MSFFLPTRIWYIVDNMENGQKNRILIYVISGLSAAILIVGNISRSMPGASLKNIFTILPLKAFAFGIGEELRDVARVPDEIYQYYPFAVGNRWEYVSQKEASVGGDIVRGPADSTDTIKSIKQDGNAFIISIESCNGEQNIELPGHCKVSFLHVEENKIYVDSWHEETLLEFPLIPNKVMYDKDYREMAGEWLGELLEEFKELRYTWSVGDKISQTVLGKNIDDCFNIEYSALGDKSKIVFCYGVGPIESYGDDSGASFNEKLVNFVEMDTE